MEAEKVTPDLKNLVQKILKESDQNVREIRHDRLQSILKQEFGVRCQLKTIKRVLQDGRWTLNLGWGRGENYLHRIPHLFQ
jgi:hypothetical protein